MVVRRIETNDFFCDPVNPINPVSITTIAKTVETEKDKTILKVLKVWGENIREIALLSEEDSKIWYTKQQQRIEKEEEKTQSR